LYALLNSEWGFYLLTKGESVDSKELLSDMIVYSKYAKYVPSLKRRENWTELVQRNADMHARRYPMIADEIYEVYGRSVLTKKVVPSMRSFQFAGRAIEKSHSRMFNCASRKLDSATAFAEVMFLLLGGSGVGISVQKHHVNEIPAIKRPKHVHRKFIVPDDIMGWANAVKVLIKSYTNGTSTIDFDFSEIRPKGTRLVTAGGLAPGAEPLIQCINNIKRVLDEAIEDRGDNTKMKPIEAHDIACYIANAVLAGGIRRSAMISLFSSDDEEMLVCKSNFPVTVVSSNKLPNNMNDVTIRYKNRDRQIVLSDWDMQNVHNGLPWYHLEEQRGRANNSVMLLRGDVTEDYFRDLMKKVEASKAGEPGVYWTNSYELGTNPSMAA
jgi:ribonucleoside-diphosphate reductase alpha chain